MLTLKGMLLGTAVFAVFAILYVIMEARLVARQMPGQTVGIDVRVLADWTVKAPLFWIALIVCIAAASLLLRYFQR